MDWLAYPVLRGDCRYHGLCARCVRRREKKMRDSDFREVIRSTNGIEGSYRINMESMAGGKATQRMKPNMR